MVFQAIRFKIGSGDLLNLVTDSIPGLVRMVGV